VRGDYISPYEIPLESLEVVLESAYEQTSSVGDSAELNELIDAINDVREWLGRLKED
jgi:hypothetical protein